MKQSIWPAVLAGLLVLPGAAQAADGAPKAETAAVKLVQMEKGAAYMDESSVHIVDAEDSSIVAEVMILRSDEKNRTSVTRAAYRISGGQKDAVRGADGTWEPVRTDSFDAACAARIRTILNDPLRQAQFVDEIQQALMKQWEAKEAGKSTAADVTVSIEPERPADAAPEEVSAETPADASKTEAAAAETKTDAAKPEAAAETRRGDTKEDPRKNGAASGGAADKAPADADGAAASGADVLVEITSREPEVTVEILPEAPVRAGAESTAPAAGV